MDHATTHPPLQFTLSLSLVSLAYFARAAGLIEGGSLNRVLGEGAMPLLLFRWYSMLISVAKVITVIISGQCRLQEIMSPPEGLL